MAICAWKECDNWFDGTNTNRGRKRIYCCPQCNKYAYRSRQNERRKIARHMAKGNVALLDGVATKARIHASLTCPKYSGCINIAYRNDGLLGCWKCTKRIYMEDAWKHEPGVLICNETDFTDHIA